MARRVKGEGISIRSTKKVTSIGQSRRSRPKNKNKRRNFKRSRGQGS